MKSIVFYVMYMFTWMFLKLNVDCKCMFFAVTCLFNIVFWRSVFDLIFWGVPWRNSHQQSLFHCRCHSEIVLLSVCLEGIIWTSNMHYCEAKKWKNMKITYFSPEFLPLYAGSPNKEKRFFQFSRASWSRSSVLIVMWSDDLTKCTSSHWHVLMYSLLH